MEIKLSIIDSAEVLVCCGSAIQMVLIAIFCSMCDIDAVYRHCEGLPTYARVIVYEASCKKSLKT